jgi:peptidoglycan hydrolase-like protein with peptidoglycan-binding domain
LKENLNSVIIDLILNLKEGSSGTSVRSLHEMLKALGYKIDNSEILHNEFGSSTKSAVGDFQRKNLLKVLGMMDSRTTNKLIEMTGGDALPFD